MSRIAFLGLGHMGLPMAINLVKAGHQVVGFDPAAAVLDAARASGIDIAPDARSAVTNVEAVITMFPNGRYVIDAYRDGLLTAAPEGTLFIDSSTISVDESRKAHELAIAAGHRSIDAPVSGGVIGAEEATLAFMVGGSDEDFADAQSLLSAMGHRIVHCGGPGLGQAGKACNNMILAVSQIVVAEAFVLGERLGLSHEALYDVVANSSGQCWALTTNCPVPGPVPTSPANRDYQPGFAGTLMAKDLGLALRAIELTRTDARMGRLAQEIYAAFAAGEGADRDFSAIITEIRDGSPLLTSR